MKPFMRLVVRVLVCIFTMLGLSATLPAQAQFLGLGSFFTWGLSLTQSEKSGRPTIYATWEYKLPGRPWLEGGDEAWKRACILPYVPGAQMRVYFPAITMPVRNVKDGRITARQELRLKERTRMKPYPAKGWGYELVFNEPGNEGQYIKRPGVYNYWGNIQVNDSRILESHFGPIRYDRKMKDEWFEWRIVFGLYQDEDGVISDQEFAELQQAKGGGGLLLGPPRYRSIFVDPVTGQQVPPLNGGNGNHTQPSNGNGTNGNGQPDSSPSERDVTIQLRGEGFTRAIFRIESGGQIVDFIEVDGGEDTFEMPEGIKEFELFIVDRDGQKTGGVKMPGGPFRPGDPEPIIISRGPKK